MEIIIMGSKTSCMGAIILLSMLFMPTFIHALMAPEIRELRTKHRLSSLLVFGDSSVDPGNNNRITTTMKSNFLPYGMDFVGGRPTGRFCDGKLGTDFVGFLDPNITKEDLLHAVSFASAGSGYDDLTSNLTQTISLSKQVEYLKHYKIHLEQYVGHKKANEILRKAVILLSMGTNDYLQNYFLEPTRPKQFTLDKYQDFLVSRMRLAIEEMHKVGAKRIGVVGVPPIGCMPIVMTFTGDGIHCVDKMNKAVLSLNSKIQKQMEAIRTQLNMKTIFVDVYNIIESAINNPKKYGTMSLSKFLNILRRHGDGSFFVRGLKIINAHFHVIGSDVVVVIKDQLWTYGTIGNKDFLGAYVQDLVRLQRDVAGQDHLS
ncbi:GDSL esterase/lipase At5g45950 isoform X2 [Spinacia oleracea]|uniref:GDSL esterase/lipase At5g45950 isoform X2 n=1 Tax=Spinacia oleracea TaxID=3562 RepID=A0ABM3R0T4_SPIOL|nr:GDSL esterase/lipase At5g45950-like isoform X2 [Spinacia oleracea]